MNSVELIFFYITGGSFHDHVNGLQIMIWKFPLSELLCEILRSRNHPEFLISFYFLFHVSPCIRFTHVSLGHLVFCRNVHIVQDTAGQNDL